MNLRIDGAATPLRSAMSRRARLAALGLALVCGWAFAAPGVFVVNTGTTDLDDKNKGDGICADVNNKCSLRAAIEEGNALAGATALTPHAITFSVAKVDVINGSLPDLRAPFIITGPTIINGTGNAFAHGCLSLTDSGTVGLGYVDGATGSTVTLLSIVNCSGDGITGNGHGYHFIGNFIGVDPTGVMKMANVGSGISLSASHAYSNVDTGSLDILFQAFPQLPIQQSDIGTFVNNLQTTLLSLNPDIISGNVISGNGGDGVLIHSENLAAVFVQNNMIGTDVTGNIAIGNGGYGVHVNADAFGNVIGPNNTISGNGADGVRVDASSVYLPNFVMGNRIGLPTLDSSQHIGNAANGIFIDTKPDGSVTNKNPTGMSLVVGPANFISDNKGKPNSDDPDTFGSDSAGVFISGASNGVKVTGNTIGMAEIPTGTPLQSNAFGNAGDGVIVTVTGNTVSGNTIAGNKRHGVLLSTTNNTSTHLLGNTIGLYPAFAGDLTLGNGFDGVHIDAASSTYVGGPNAGDANTIGGNGRNGVKIRHGGTSNGWANLVQRNMIYGNARGNPNAQPVALPAGMGIGLDLDHVENAADGPHDEFPANDANLDQAPPVICIGAAGEPIECSGFTAPKSIGGTTTFDWVLKTHGPAKFRAEFFQINAADDNAATSMLFLGEQADIQTDAAGHLSGAGCSSTRCSATVAANAAGAYVTMTITDITDLLDTPQNGGDWKGLLTCFVGDLGIILPACTANNTSEMSNVAALPLSNNAALSNLTISSGALTPTFDTATFAYTDAVSNATTSVTVTPTVADASATIKVNTVAVASGSASGAIGLAIGMNTISVVVTAQDGTTVETYTIVVNRAAALSNDAALSNLAISAGTLTPAFATATLSYTDAVPNATASVTVTPITSNANATIKVNNVAVASGMASGAINLAVGMNTIDVVVTAQDTTTIQTYSVVVNRAAPAVSNDASLSNLTISSGTLTPAFSATTLGYTDAVSNATTSVTVTPTTSNVNATIKVNNVAVASGATSGAINLAVGNNTINVVVTAQDTTTVQTYSIVVNRAAPAASNNAALSNLALSSGTLTPSFLTSTLSYTDAVTNATTSVTVTPTVADANATIKVNNVAATSGIASNAINLVVGNNTINVVVTAQDTTTVQTYSIVVNRTAAAASNDAALSNLAISSGTLAPVFATSTLSYADSVTNATASVTVTPTTADANATIKVNNVAVTSGSASGAINLAVGNNTINVVVTAQDTTTVQTYSIIVNRAAAAVSNNAALSNLAISSGTLTPVFATATLSYADSVTNATTSVTVTPTTSDANASVKVNNVAVTSGNASGAINLAVGNNTINVVVTAQDTTTVRTYAIVVNRAAAAVSNDAALSNLAISSGTLAPAFAAATLTYSDAVSNTTASITVTPSTADANATVTINGNTVSSGSASGAINLAVGANTISVVVTAQDGTTVRTYTIDVTRASAAVTTFTGTTATNTGTATAVLSGGGASCSIASAAFVSPSAAPPNNVTFPDGLLQFATTGCVGSITMTVTFPTAFAAGEKYWKYGPTSGQASAHWYSLGAANSVSLSGHTATFTIADGGLGDDDLGVNGNIVDAGGPGVNAGGGTGGGPGGIVPTPALSTWALLAMIGLLTMLGARRAVRVRR